MDGYLDRLTDRRIGGWREGGSRETWREEGIERGMDGWVHNWIERQTDLYRCGSLDRMLL